MSCGCRIIRNCTVDPEIPQMVTMFHILQTYKTCTKTPSFLLYSFQSWNKWQSCCMTATHPKSLTIRTDGWVVRMDVSVTWSEDRGFKPWSSQPWGALVLLSKLYSNPKNLTKHFQSINYMCAIPNHWINILLTWKGGGVGVGWASSRVELSGN